MSYLLFAILSFPLLAAPSYWDKCCKNQYGVKTCDRSIGKLICNDGKFAYDCTCPKRNKFFPNKTGGDRYPENARVNDYGDGWECKKGYLQDGRDCEAIDLPSNAEYFHNLNGWRCKDGYLQKRYSCKRLIIPKHATLSSDGRNWKCDHGYEMYRAKCRKIKLPKDSKLDFTGNHWVCREGFKPRFNKCVPK